MKLFFILGAINAMLAVGLGAFGAHGLEGKIPEKYIEIWNKGVQYQMFHAIGLFIVAFLADKLSGVSLVPTGRSGDACRYPFLLRKPLCPSIDSGEDSRCHYPNWRSGVYCFLDHACHCSSKKFIS
nr:DUF423 domain-containing protein [Bacillus pumilus]